MSANAEQFDRHVDAMEGKVCGFDKKPCVKHQCGHYQLLRGTDFQTNEKIARWDCAFNSQHLMAGEQGKATKEMAEDLHALKQNLHVMVEALLTAAGRQDVLEWMRARTNHINALTRTDEIQRRNRREAIENAGRDRGD